MCLGLEVLFKAMKVLLVSFLALCQAHSFPRASLSENCSLLGTDNVQGEISEHIFTPNGDYCLFIISLS